MACHLECVQNSDCSLNQACLNNKCVNPCNGACGTDASCDVINHYPVCFCDQGLQGDPFVHCQPKRGGMNETYTILNHNVAIDSHMYDVPNILYFCLQISLRDRHRSIHVIHHHVAQTAGA